MGDARSTISPTSAERPTRSPSTRPPCPRPPPDFATWAAERERRPRRRRPSRRRRRHRPHRRGHARLGPPIPVLHAVGAPPADRRPVQPSLFDEPGRRARRPPSPGWARTATRARSSPTSIPGLQKRPRDLDLPPWLKGRYGTAVGRAVHGVLQTIDLATGDGLDDAVAAQCQAEAVPDRADDVRRLVQDALGSPSVQAAASAPRTGARCTRARPIGDRLLEGYVDLLYRGRRRARGRRPQDLRHRRPRPSSTGASRATASRAPPTRSPSVAPPASRSPAWCSCSSPRRAPSSASSPTSPRAMADVERLVQRRRGARHPLTCIRQGRATTLVAPAGRPTRAG